MTDFEKFINSIKAIGEFVTGCSPIAIAYFAWKQNKMSKKQDVIHNQINGMKDQLMKETKDAGLAEGNLAGRKEQTQERKDEKQ